MVSVEVGSNFVIEMTGVIELLVGAAGVFLMAK